MEALTFELITTSFLAGILMFLAPCTLPLVPAFLAFISGVSFGDKNVQPVLSPAAHQQIIRNSFAFTLGFSIVFISFGILLGLLGGLLGEFRVLLSQLGGALIIFFGLMMLGVVRISPLLKDRKLSAVRPGNTMSSALIGATFALGWTPCIGPVLATILLLASTSSSAFAGGLLLAVFSFGMSLPFILTAVLYSRADQFISQYAYLSRYVNIIGGVFLILIGGLLITQNFGLTVEYGSQIFYWLGWERLFDYF